MKPFNLDRTVRLFIGIAITILILWLLDTLKGVLLPFCVATLIAYMLEPFVQFNRKLLRLKGRVVAITITLFEITLATVVLCWFFIPMIVSEVESMGHMLATYATTEFDIPYIPESVHDFIRKNIDFNQITYLINDIDWPTILENIISGLWSVISGSISFILGLMSWAIVILYVFFIMLDYERLGNLFHNMVPPRMRPVCYTVMNDVKTSMNNYFRGQALVAFIVGILFCIGFLIVGLPMAIVMGLFIGVLNMVPYLQLISFIPAGFLCMVYSVSHGVAFWPFFAQVFLVYCVVQVIQDLYLTPKIMGKAMGLNPAIILLSLSVWGTLLGFMGMIIALPLTTLCLSYYNRYIIKDKGEEFYNVEKIEETPEP
ncbi:MAG: AI-2E family transporter [Muribaculaceae bacterium]|nr:AI-2E family transporter [Muribaculaceae bacterium]